MLNEITYFSIPKIGEEEKDIQDAFSFSVDKSLVAIADGVSSSLYPKEWANLLVHSFCGSSETSIESVSNFNPSWLKPLQEEWIKIYLERKKSQQIPWWAKGSEHNNYASATFIGLRFRKSYESERSVWEAITVGDSCLFKTNCKVEKLEVFPWRSSKDFYSRTNAFHSLPQFESPEPTFMKDGYESGDIFLLATDALSQWILIDYEQKIGRWKKLTELQGNDEFTRFIKLLRNDKLIKNDDTTLAIIKTEQVNPNNSEVEIPEHQLISPFHIDKSRIWKPKVYE